MKKLLSILKRFLAVKSQAEADEQNSAALRKKGVSVGQRCRIYSSDFSTEPYLVTIGDDVAIAGGVKVITHNGAARLLKKERPNIQSLGQVSIGSDTFIGENALILPSTVIGSHCIICAGAVVHGKIPDNSLVAGNPAKIIGRASLYLERLKYSPNTLDTFELEADQRQRLIKAHFNGEK